MRCFEFNRALVRLPSASVVHGLRAGDGPDPSSEEIRREHAAYVTALVAAGLAVTMLPALDAWPDSVFVEDPALVFEEGAIVLRSAAPTRRGEAHELESELRRQFERVLVLAEGTVDGGDVLVTPQEVLIGLSARTDSTGATALVDLLAWFGRRARVVRTPPAVLHLKSAASLLDSETILATASLAASGLFPGFRVLVVPEGEEHAANALRLNERVLASANCPLALELLNRHGYDLLPLSTSGICRLDAGLSCMSLRWKS